MASRSRRAAETGTGAGAPAAAALAADMGFTPGPVDAAAAAAPPPVAGAAGGGVAGGPSGIGGGVGVPDIGGALRGADPPPDEPPPGAPFADAHSRDRRWPRPRLGGRSFPLRRVDCTAGLVHRSCASRSCIAVGHASRIDPRASDARHECALECCAADNTKRSGPRCDTSRPQRASAQRTLSLQGPMAANDISTFAGCRPCLTPPPSKNSTLSLATL